MITKKPFYRMQRSCRFFTNHKGMFSDYRYNWALTIKPDERKIELLYQICGTILEREKAIIYWLIEQKKSHLDGTKTLSIYHAFKDQDKKDDEARQNKNRKRDRLTRQQAEMYFYRQAKQILLSAYYWLTPTNKRICKQIICHCGRMSCTIEIMMELDKND